MLDQNEKRSDEAPKDTDTENKRGRSIRATIEDAAMNTGAHGIANIYRTQNIARKIFWCVVFFAGLGKCNMTN